MLLLERGPLGGKARRLERIENIPGFSEGISGKSLMRRYWGYARRWGLSRERGEAVSLRGTAGEYRVATGAGERRAKAVVVSTGTRFLRWSGLDGGGLPVYDAAFGRAREFRGRQVAVVGGGEAAIHQSLYLAEQAKTVYLIHRGERLKGIGLLKRRAASARNLRVLPSSTLTVGKEGPLVVSGGGRRRTPLRVAAVFALIGQEPELSLLGKRRPGPGIFVAGDASRGAVRQVAWATGDGMRAAMECDAFLNAL